MFGGRDGKSRTEEKTLILKGKELNSFLFGYFFFSKKVIPTAVVWWSGWKIENQRKDFNLLRKGAKFFSFWLLFLFSKEKVTNYARYSLREAGTFSTSTEIVIVKLTLAASRTGLTSFANFSSPARSS